MKEKYLLTVIVPVYNVERYLHQCLNSLRSQTNQSFKAILVDDGSTDGSGSIADAFAARDPARFRVLHQENAGLGAARNAGLALADTPYVEFLDSDDWLLPRTVEQLYKAVQKHTEPIDIYFTLPPVYDMSTRQFKPWMDEALLHEIFQNNAVACPQRNERMYDLEPNVNRSVWRLAFLREHDFAFPEGVKWEDVLPHFYLYYYAQRCAVLPDAGFCYRMNSGGQITASIGAERMDVFTVFEQVFACAGQNQWDDTIGAHLVQAWAVYLRWTMDAARGDILRQFIPQAYRLTRTIPRGYLRAWYKSVPATSDLRVIITGMQMPAIHRIFADYLLVENGRKAWRKWTGKDAT